MKKYINHFLFLGLLLGVASCSEDTFDPRYYGNLGQTVLKDNKISTLDANQDIILNPISLKAGVTVSKVEIYNTDKSTKLSDATMSGSKTTFNTSVLGNLVAGKSHDLVLTTNFSDGTKVDTPYSLAIGDGITMTKEVSNIRYLDTTKTTIKFETYKVYATVSKVELYTKKGAKGTYVLNNKVLKVDSDEIDLGKIDFTNLAVNDTVYYKFKAIAATTNATSEVETKFAIVTQNLGASTNGSITENLASNKYNLAISKSYADTNTKDGEIKYTSPFGFMSEGATKIQFVKNAIGAIDYDKANLFDAEAKFNTGTKVTTVNDLSKGDVIVYQIIRGTKTYYGLIKVSSSILVDNSETLEFSSKEGTIIKK